MAASKMVVDTSIFIDHLRSKNKFNSILSNIPDEHEIFVSSVTIYELLMGATSPEKWKDVETLTRGLPVLAFTENVAIRASKIFHELKKENKMIEFRDIFIAATTLSYNLPVLTLNTKDFTRIKGVQLIDPISMNF